MSDLQLESLNKAGQTTTLEAVPNIHESLDDSGEAGDFIGDFVLKVVPTAELYPPPEGLFPNSSIGGIFCSSVGTGTGLTGSSQSGQGVRGVGPVGVLGDAVGQNAVGVHGRIIEGSGVGVRGEGSPGVSGTSFAAAGVQGEGSPGVAGQCSLSPIALETIAHPDPGHFAGVNGNSVHGPGVFGTGVYGGQFQGSRAQLSLLPGTGVGKPTTGSHALGEIYMDSAASLFVCIASGLPGTWVKVVTA